jgi:O-antigen/teichoic acid export membrane protein
MGLLTANVGLVALSSQYRAMLVGQQSFRSANWGDIVKQGSNLGLLALVIVAGILAGTQSAAWVAVANAGAVLSASAFYRRALGNRARSVAGSGIREAVRYSLPCAGSNLVQFLNYRFGVYFVNAYAGMAALGLYQTASLMAQSLSILPGAVAAITFPAVAHGCAKGSDKAPAAAQCARLILWISLLCGGLLALLAPVSIPVHFGAGFEGSIPVLLILLPAAVIFCPAQVLASYLAGAGKPHLNLYASAIGAVLTVVFNALWVPSHGILGAAAGTAVAQIVNACLLHTFFVAVSGCGELFRPTRRDLQLVSHITQVAKRRICAA